MTRADRIAAEAKQNVSRWPSMNSRIARIFPLEGGGAEVSLAGVDRRFDTVFAAVQQVEAMGLTARVMPFDPTPLVLAESPALQVL